MSKPSRGTTSFHDPPPADKGRYRNILEKAKKKAEERPGPLEGTPRFDDLPTQAETGPPDGREKLDQLRPETARGLEALAQANAPNEAPDEESALVWSGEAEPEIEKSPEEKLREVIESRLEPLDIGRYLMGGALIQEVPIVPDKLVVVYRTVTDLEEVWVDDALSKKGDITGRQFLRFSNEYALAAHIYALNGVKWPEIFDGDGNVSDKAMDLRIGNTRKVASPIFQLLVQNLTWFLDRVNQSLTAEALGNG